MMDEKHLLTQQNVIWWKYGEEYQPFTSENLDDFLRKLLGKTRKPEKQKEKILAKIQEALEELQETDEQIRQNEDKEEKLLTIAPAVKKIFSEIDANRSPPGEEWITTDEVDVPSLDALDYDSLEGTFRVWVLPRSALKLEGQRIVKTVINPEDQRIVETVVDLREKRFQLQVKKNGDIQGLRLLLHEAIKRNIPIPEEAQEFIKEKKPVESEAAFQIHNEDCTSFTFRGTPYLVGPPQGKAIRLLYERYQSGSPDVPVEDIKEVMGLPETSDLRDSFRKQGLWNTLIVSGKKNWTRRLNLPDPPNTR